MTSSREQEALLPELAVFPNPASERLQVQWESQKRTTFRVEVYDLNGRLLLPQPQQSMLGVQSTMVDLGSLPQGGNCALPMVSVKMCNAL